MKETSPIKIKCMSFGHKYGDITDADFLFDARVLPNPYYNDALRDKTGFDKMVRDYVMDSDISREYLDGITNLLVPLLPLYAEAGRQTLTVAIGCTGGKHRSVTLALYLTERLREMGYDACDEHRDIDKK